MSNVFDEFFEELGFEGEGLFRDEWTGGKDDFLGELGVGREQAPVDEAAVAQIRVLALLGDVFEEILQDFLAVFRLVKVELHAAYQNLLLDDIRLIFEVLHEVGHEFIGIVDDFDVLSNDPDDGGFGLRVVEVVEVLADIC